MSSWGLIYWNGINAAQNQIQRLFDCKMLYLLQLVSTHQNFRKVDILLIFFLQEDLLIHGDSIYDIVDKQDHPTLHVHLTDKDEQSPSSTSDNLPKSTKSKKQIFLCRINVSRNARRQMRFGDQKVILVKGHFYSDLPLCSRDEPVFVAWCSPLAMPENREIVVQGATNVFTTVHSLDMKIIEVDDK